MAAKRNFNDLIEVIKTISIGAVENQKPTAIFFGTVTSTSPLKIQVDQKLILGPLQLVLTKTVAETDALAYGDAVVLLRVQGGQKFIVIDKVGEMS